MKHLSLNMSTPLRRIQFIWRQGQCFIPVKVSLTPSPPLSCTFIALGWYLSSLKSAPLWLLSRIFPLKSFHVAVLGRYGVPTETSWWFFFFPFTAEEVPISRKGVILHWFASWAKTCIVVFPWYFTIFIFCRNDCRDTMAYGHIWTLICEQKAFFPPLCPLILHHPIISGRPRCVQFTPFGLSFRSTGVQIFSKWNIIIF